MHDEDQEYPERYEDDADDGDPKRTGTTHRPATSISLSPTSTVLRLSGTGPLFYINLNIMNWEQKTKKILMFMNIWNENITHLNATVGMSVMSFSRSCSC